MRRLTSRWRDGFDWRAQEATLNAFDQFRVPLDGVDLRFIHQPGVGPHPLPLLLLHGWPGSVWEFHDLIPPLTDRARFGGAHLNFLPLPSDMPFPGDLTDEDRACREEIRHWQTEETGYSLIQGTRPQTPAYVLTDSPTGLAAWIAEEFHVWTDHDSGLEVPELLASDVAAFFRSLRAR